MDNSQIVPQPKATDNLPQPEQQRNGANYVQPSSGQRRDRASRSPVKDRQNPRAEFVAPQQYQNSMPRDNY